MVSRITFTSARCVVRSRRARLMVTRIRMARIASLVTIGLTQCQCRSRMVRHDAHAAGCSAGAGGAVHQLMVA